MAKQKIRLLVVDDHPSVVLGIKAALAGNDVIQVVGDAQDAESAIIKARKLRPDVVLLDVSMPDKNGMDVMKELLPDMPTTKFLIHTIHDDKELLYAFRQAGASGYLLKSSLPQKLRKAILDVSANKRVFESIKNEISQFPFNRPAVAGQIKPEAGNGAHLDAIRLKYGFTPKEMKVVELILKGMSMRQVSDRLDLAYNTMTSHFKHVYKKLGVHTRAKAITKLIGIESD